MQTHTTTRRRNRVFKSLHKPLTYLGVERTLFFFVCVGEVDLQLPPLCGTLRHVAVVNPQPTPIL